MEDGFRLAHNYLYHYERELVSIKDKDVRICEFGCGEGASLKMWNKYFGNGVIWGVDLNPHAKSFEEDRIHVLLGNSAERTTADELSQIGNFDIIVDDSSHAWGDIRSSFEMLWQTITPGGLYIVEDITCGSKGAFPSYPPTVYDAQSISDYFKDRTSILEYALDWAPDYNRYHFECLPEHIKAIEMSIDEVKYINGAIMVRKRG